MPEVTFFPRSNNDKANSYNLYCRVYVNKQTSEFSIKEKVDPNAWDQEKQIHNGSTDEKNNYINLLCERIKYKIKTIALMYEGEPINPEKVIKKFQNPQIKEEPTLLFDILQKYIEWERSETELKEVTIAIHERHIRHLKEYANNKKIYINEFNAVAAERFKDWFRESRKTDKKNSASRPISFAREALQWAIKKGHIQEHHLLFYEPERDKVKKPEALTEEELLKIFMFQFQSQMLNNIKDLFLFQVATGISYGDIWSDYTIEDTPEGKIIIGKRNKGNGNPFFVPYDETADIILKKHNYKLPVYCNGTYNRLLKEITALVVIKKRVNTHSARKTFATLKFAQGWTVQAVSLMLGHSSTATTETYYIEKNIQALLHEIRERNRTNQTT